MDSFGLLNMRFICMRTGIEFAVSPTDRRRLEAVVSAPSSPRKHVWRARIILFSADGIGTSAIMSATGKSKTCVWCWQERFMVAGVDGLCCTNPLKDSSFESSVVSGGHEQTHTPRRQDQELARV